MATNEKNQWDPWQHLKNELSNTGVISDSFKSLLRDIAQGLVRQGYKRGLKAAAEIADKNGAKATADSIRNMMDTGIAD